MTSGFPIILFLISALALQTANAQLCLAEHNAERQKVGKPPLTWNSKLEQAANNHNNFMYWTSCFAHQCSGETMLAVRVTSLSYYWNNLAENIAINQTECVKVVAAWMGSPIDKDNIVGNYVNIGCANKTCGYGCKPNSFYWTCVYGTPGAAPTQNSTVPNQNSTVHTQNSTTPTPTSTAATTASTAATMTSTPATTTSTAATMTSTAATTTSTAATTTSTAASTTSTAATTTSTAATTTSTAATTTLTTVITTPTAATTTSTALTTKPTVPTDTSNTGWCRYLFGWTGWC